MSARGPASIIGRPRPRCRSASTERRPHVRAALRRVPRYGARADNEGWSLYRAERATGGSQWQSERSPKQLVRRQRRLAPRRRRAGGLGALREGPHRLSGEPRTTSSKARRRCRPSASGRSRSCDESRAPRTERLLPCDAKDADCRRPGRLAGRELEEPRRPASGPRRRRRRGCGVAAARRLDLPLYNPEDDEPTETAAT
jgi:hypothetical protein